jgi:hypothetical protein
LNPVDCPGLAHLFGAYFHQDWVLEADEPKAVIAQFAHGEGTEAAARAAAEAEGLLASPLSESELQTLLDEWGCEYYLPADGLTARTWLAQVAAYLKG